MNRFVEENQIIPIIMPVDLATAANSGDWIKVKDYSRATFIMLADVGTAGQDLVIALKQATDAAGGSEKACNAITRYDYKRGATLLSAIAQFTRADQTADDEISDAAGGENEQLTVFDVDLNLMDSANGFDWLTVNMADAGATAGKIGCVICILSLPRQSREVLVGAIA